jgi:hypothetical protein
LLAEENAGVSGEEFFVEAVADRVAGKGQGGAVVVPVAEDPFCVSAREAPGGEEVG